MSMTNLNKPVVLILGATGLTGRYLIEELDLMSDQVHVRVAARRPEHVDKFRADGRDAVLLDLDDPKTFIAALFGVDRLFLLTGCSVAMLAQSKSIVDAARKARVSHIVHLGTFGNWDVTDPDLAWHQLVECYIEASGIAWTHLHPNVFMELLPTFMPIGYSSFPVYWGEGRAGWIASRNIAAAAAVILRADSPSFALMPGWLPHERVSAQTCLGLSAGVGRDTGLRGSRGSP
jgi:NAD(P)H dehydrogenase (quinone)